MNNKMIKILTDLGLEDKQSKIYLALLELGEATVQEIAKKTAIKRTGLYFILDQLKKQGFVFQAKIGKRTYYQAENPDELLKQYKYRVEKFGDQLEVLRLLGAKKTKRPRMYFFEGAEGFKKIWQIIFKSGIEEFLIITDPREMHGFVRKQYITGKVIKEKKKLGIKSRQLIAASEYAKEIMADDRKENRESKVLPHTHKIHFTTIIFGNHVALISPHLENIMFIIQSEAYAKTQKSLFETLWELLPEGKSEWQRGQSKVQN